MIFYPDGGKIFGVQGKSAKVKNTGSDSQELCLYRLQGGACQCFDEFQYTREYNSAT